MNIMKIKNIILGVAALGSFNVALANGGGVSSTPMMAPITKGDQERGFYVGIEGGASMQNGLEVTPDYSDLDKTYFTGVIDSYPYDDSNSAAYVFGAKVGYFFNSQISMDLAYDYHGNYDYYSAIQDDALQYVSSITDVNSQTIMLNLNFFPKLDWGNFKPFISVGAGVAFNDSGTYNSRYLELSGGYGPVVDYDINSDTKTSFAWQVGAGANYFINDNMFLTVGYRFVNLGGFESSDQAPDNITDSVDTQTPWMADHVYTNEFYLGFNYKFGK